MQRVIEAAEHVGIVRALQPLHDRRNTSLAILAYHRVMPIDGLDAYPFDPELISATPTEFEWQMEYLRRTSNLVSLEAVVAHLDGDTPLPPRAVAVTFDDGFSDTYRYAFPILKRYSVPATIFVATGYVESGEPFWFELAAYLAFRVAPGTLEVPYRGVAFPVGASLPERTQSLRQLQEILKGLPNEGRLATISAWQKRFAAEIAHGAVAHSGPISWAQIREMAAAGIAFGSHTVTHPNLTQVGNAELDWELAESRRMLEGALDRPVRTLAYPIGTRASFDERVIAAAGRAGFRLGLTYVAGANAVASLDRFTLKRHGIGLGTTPHYFRALSRLPAWLN